MKPSAINNYYHDYDDKINGSLGPVPTRNEKAGNRVHNPLSNDYQQKNVDNRITVTYERIQG